MPVSRKPYCISLSGYLAECDINYWRLSRLVRDADQEDDWEYGVTLTSTSTGRLQIRVMERCRFTTMLDLIFTSGVQHTDISRMSVRMYHDIRTVEVVACNDVRALASRYDYPNPAMRHPDEKEQLNRLFGEWLMLCLRHGHIDNELIFADHQEANPIAG